MQQFFVYAQIILAVLLIAAILLQSRGSGLGSAWGGGGEMYVSRRGVEKLLFKLTVLVAFLFISVSFISLLA